MSTLSEEMTYADKPWLKSYSIGPFKVPQTMEPYPKINVYKFLDDAATNYPDNVACVYLDEQITYETLKLHVDKFATALASLGVKKGDKVATILPSCIQFIIADYAIMYLGAIHVPLSILHKASELLYEINESVSETIICSYRRLERINSIKDQLNVKNLIYTVVPIFPDYSLPEPKEVPNAHRLEELIERFEPNLPDVEINPMEHLALLPFTGGTTGLPKGTMLTHYNLTTNVIQSIQWMMKPLEAGIKGKAAAVICVPLFHMFGHWALHACISWGIRMYVVDARDIDQIAEIIKKYRPFIVLGVPTHFMQLLEKDIPRMSVFFCSGAAPLPPEVAERFEKKVGVPMGEGYGMTEASPATHINISAFSKVTGFMAKVKRSIGLPLPDTDVKIVNPETGEEVPFGETGELWIRGPQVMAGYWPSFGKGLQEEGWLATGDIGKMDEDGYFYIVDRIKDMINVSGMKVYSRVIDDTLYEHPAVSEVAVIGIPDPNRIGSERVKVFISLRADFEGKITTNDIIDYCKEKLPPYAVPKSVEFRKTLPLTIIGKVWKKKLKEEELAKMKD
ncbi:MAG: AMP-binding protein [Candidatus Hodarchaeota archaeon]